MNRLFSACVPAVCLLVLAAWSAGAAPRWRTISSDRILVLYPEERESEALEALAVLEEEQALVGSIVGGRLRRVAVSIQDAGIESNGLTDPAFARIVLFPTAPGQGELAFHESWWRLVGVHEYTHWRHASAAAGFPGFLAAAAGTWAAPGNFTPSWLKEGVCVYAESGLSPFEGRLNEGTYEAILAALARDGRLPSLVEATFQPVGFPGAGVSVRLLGGSFLAYLARTRGPESLPRFFEHFASSGLSYLSPLLPWVGLDRSARRVFGQGMRALWLDWQLDLIDRYPPPGPSVPAAGEQAGLQRPGFEQPGLEQPGWQVGPSVSWQGVVYYQRRRPVKAAAFEVRWLYELVRHDPARSTEVLCTTTAPFHGPMRVRDGTLYFALKELRPRLANRELGSYGYEAVLCALDLRGSRRVPRVVLRGGFRGFEVLPGGAVLLSVDRIGAFGSEIRLAGGGASRPLLDSDWRVEELLHDGEGWLYLSARTRGRNPGLYRVPLSLGQVQALRDGETPSWGEPEKIVDTPYAEGEISLWRDLLLFSANWSGNHAVYAWNRVDGSLARQAGGEAFAASASGAGQRLYFTGLEADGYRLRSAQPALVPVTPPEPSRELLPTPLQPREAPRRGRAGYLRNLGSLRPRALVPLLGLDSSAGSLVAGGTLGGRSALGDVSYAVSAYYDSAGRKPELAVSLQALAVAPLLLSAGYATAGDDRLSVALQLPLYRSLRPGLSHVAVGLAGSIFEDDYSRLSIEPLLRLRLQAPRGALELAGSISLESKALGSTVEDRALLAALDWRQLLFGARLELSASGVHDLAGRSWTLPAPRGYGTAGLETGSGALFSAELSLPLLRLRRGLWNPAVFFEDLFLAPFFDLAADELGELQWSAGGGVHLEVKGLAQDEGLALDLFVGLLVTADGQPGFFLGLELPLLETLYAGAGPALGLPGVAAPRPAP